MNKREMIAKGLTTFRTISREYNITASVLKRAMIEKNVIYIKDVPFRKKGLIRAKNSCYCFDVDKSIITYFYQDKVQELMEYLELREIPDYKILCRECLQAKDVFRFYHGLANTCSECILKLYHAGY